jgi:N-acetylmuramoyl-L-alanine amidase/Bacterial SH3 domain
MTTQFGFTKITIAEFEQWLLQQRIARTILFVQQHHTFSPSYALFNNNHFELQQGMKNFHVNHNGWADIGQHFTTFPDGVIVTGRNLELSPACITGNNANAMCIENLGNFDSGKDVMTPAQKETIIRMTAAMCKRYNIAVNIQKIVYHHWFNLASGVRNNGAGNNKTCPGTNFFGGNQVADCENNFLPLVRNAMGGVVTDELTNALLKYVCVTSKTLNIRKQAAAESDKVTDRAPATFGAVLRVCKEKNGWLKISATKQHWVLAKFTKEVTRAVVIANALNVRSGAGSNFPKAGGYLKGQELFISDEQNGWCKILLDDKWVSKEFLKFGT